MRFDIMRATSVASPGLNYVELILPVGSKLRAIYARNTATGWQLILLALNSMSQQALDANTLGLAWESQDGPNTGIKWSGDISLGQSFRKVTASFYGCVAGDFLALNVGVEQ